MILQKRGKPTDAQPSNSETPNSISTSPKAAVDGQGIARRFGDGDSAMASGRLSIAMQVRLQILVRSHYSPEIHNETHPAQQEEQQHPPPR